MSFALLTFVALMVEGACGYPGGLFRAVRHPVVWMGALIALLDGRLNRDTRAGGVVALAVLIGTVGAVAWGVQAGAGLLPGWGGVLAAGVVASSLLAQQSLGGHVAAVAAGLGVGLAEGRAAVSHIVGRDPAALDAAGVARAAIESLAENFSDGVVAPVVWGCALGLPGMALYKAANTADSMIGHRTVRHGRFGWAAARFDDLVNLPASRLAAAWIVVAACVVPGARAGAAVRAVWRDAGGHRSPNAGWPEAAMAGALGVRLAGPRAYGGVLVVDGWMGDGGREVTGADIGRALMVYRVACGVQAGVVGVLAAVL